MYVCVFVYVGTVWRSVYWCLGDVDVCILLCWWLDETVDAVAFVTGQCAAIITPACSAS